MGRDENKGWGRGEGSLWRRKAGPAPGRTEGKKERGRKEGREGGIRIRWGGHHSTLWVPALGFAVTHTRACMHTHARTCMHMHGSSCRWICAAVGPRLGHEPWEHWTLSHSPSPSMDWLCDLDRTPPLSGPQFPHMYRRLGSFGIWGAPQLFLQHFEASHHGPTPRPGPSRALQMNVWSSAW